MAQNLPYAKPTLVYQQTRNLYSAPVLWIPGALFELKKSSEMAEISQLPMLDLDLAAWVSLLRWTKRAGSIENCHEKELYAPCNKATSSIATQGKAIAPQDVCDDAIHTRT